VKSSNLITAFNVEQNGQLKDTTVVSADSASNTRVEIQSLQKIK
jgi:heme-binding NEAT domain protein